MSAVKSSSAKGGFKWRWKISRQGIASWEVSLWPGHDTKGYKICVRYQTLNTGYPAARSAGRMSAPFPVLAVNY